jgi:hypothetical protein
MRRGLQPLTDEESYVHEGPNGTPRSKKDVSPKLRLTATLAERKKR